MNSVLKWHLIATVLLATAWTASAEQKTAFINMERVFDEYHKTKTANAQFKARGGEIDTQRKELVTKAKALKEDSVKLNAECRDKSLNDNAREKKREAAEEKLNELREAEEKLMGFDKVYKKEITNQMRQMQMQIVGEIRGVIQTYATENKIDMVFDSSGKTLNNVESVMYFDKRMDITEPILTIMNKNAPETEKENDAK
ncbi:MAG: OmpH family outer membrane protein [Kiritimatiellia bacterium]|nr:OmpH family outer membrane protein [Kiritimatiellia bacterium]